MREPQREKRGAPDPDPIATSLDALAIEAVVHASHGDPFAILGPHQIEDGLWEIRALLPQARSVRLVAAQDERPLATMRRLHVDGLFVVRLTSRELPRYRFEIEGHGPRLLHDPYCFGPVLDDHRLHALTEGEDPFVQFGAHFLTHEGVKGASFVVWAPNARRASVVGDWNDWDGRRHPMRLRHPAGAWELFIPELQPGARYKFEILGPNGEMLPLRADPFAFAAERPPATASILQDLPWRTWSDAGWIEKRRSVDQRRSPISIYECHLASWARVPEEGGR
ncbi:MAG TPA: 1,4-alpha-glucan branching enzyme, partial [Beijerinckiaceae bacterium]|nr:1,4-alpha-glucan branching enzyme [Beijerinckiaceae bacterium]